MDYECLSEFQNKYVKIELSNGQYFKGRIISVNKHSVVMIDFLGKRVSLDPNFIQLVQEVKDAY